MTVYTAKLRRGYLQPRRLGDNFAFAPDKLWEIAREKPAFSLDFTKRSIVDQIGGVSGAFTRPSTPELAWDGTQFVSYAADQPAWALGPNGLWGLQMAPGAANLYLNSTAPATQGISVTAQQYTLSFYGTGTLTLSGASTAGPLVGTGAAPNRVSLTFTPSAGTLTLTLTGSITKPQLETGPAATPPIDTAGGPVTRAVDAFVFGPGAAFDSWYNQAGGVWQCIGSVIPAAVGTNGAFGIEVSASAGANFMRAFRQSDSQPVFSSDTAGVGQFAFGMGATWTDALPRNMAISHALNNTRAAVNGGTVQSDASCTLVTYDRLRVGSLNNGGAPWNGIIHRLDYYPPGPAADRIQQLSAAVL